MPWGTTWSLLIPPLPSLRLEGAVREERQSPDPCSTQQRQGPALSSGETFSVLAFGGDPGLHPFPRWTLKASVWPAL